MVYKLLSKVLANKLKSVLTKCLSIEQSAFIVGRSILDNVIVANEIIHHMKCKTKGTQGEVALKIDISKAYDRVDWGYLRAMMVKMGFSARWVAWIMLCVSSVSYSVMVNGDSVGLIFPGRGMRQGDLLFPYLFIICAEGLSALIKKAERTGDLHGVKICRGAPIISHLLFADDSFLFSRATDKEAMAMKNILSDFESAFGQAINLQKSEVFFNRNMSQNMCNNFSSLLGVQQCLGTGKHLGLPSMVGRSKKATFAILKSEFGGKLIR